MIRRLPVDSRIALSASLCADQDHKFDWNPDIPAAHPFLLHLRGGNRAWTGLLAMGLPAEEPDVWLLCWLERRHRQWLVCPPCLLHVSPVGQGSPGRQRSNHRRTRADNRCNCNTRQCP